MSTLRCFPIIWDNSRKRLTKQKRKGKLHLVKMVEFGHLFYFTVSVWTTIQVFLGGCQLHYLLPTTLAVLFNLILQLGNGVKFSRQGGFTSQRTT